MQNQVVKHVVTGKRAEVETDSRGTLWLIVDGTRQRWIPEDGDWMPDSHLLKPSATQIAQVVFAADVELRAMLGIGDEATHWLNLRPEIRSRWITGELPAKDLTPRHGMAVQLRNYLGALNVE